MKLDGDFHVYTCPWVDCGWTLHRPTVVMQGNVVGIRQEDRNRLAAESITKAIVEDREAVDQELLVHLDSIHPGWTPEEARAQALRARVHPVAPLLHEEFTPSDAPVIDGEVVHSAPDGAGDQPVSAVGHNLKEIES